jgi:hypothetical protein
MKTKRMFTRTFICLLVLLMVTPMSGLAQGQPPERRFGQEELDQMLAPIALYPDSLLAQILMAATYPLEVVQAERWVRANRNLTGDQLNDALDRQDWDPSVKALVPFPQILSMMSERLEWTQKLGDAFLDQQEEVMDTVQRLRARAQAAGNLGDTEQQRVIVQERVIEIVPVQPEVIYVPVYDPMVVYGPWWYPAFPPFFFPPPPGVIIIGGFGFWRGVTVGRAWLHVWGHWDWHHHHVNVNINRRININRHISVNRADIQTTPWRHDVRHRKGVSYRNETTRERFGQVAKGAEKRRAFRGFGQETKYQQKPVTTRRGPDVAKGGQSSVTTRQDVPKTTGRQDSATTHRDFNKTWGGQPPVTTRQDVGKTRAGQAPAATTQGFEQRKGVGGFGQNSFDLSRSKSAFGGLGRGSDARMESNRGFQSRQGTSSKWTGGMSKGNVGRGGGSGGGSKGDVGRPR